MKTTPTVFLSAMASLAAVASLSLTSCETPGQSAAAGAAAGALGGAIIGNQSGETAEGALIGGAVGGAAGYGVGKVKEDRRRTYYRPYGGY